MRSRTPSLFVTLNHFLLAAGSLAALVTAPDAARATVILVASETGAGDTVISGGGTLDVTSLSFFGNTNVSTQIRPDNTTLIVGDPAVGGDLYTSTSAFGGPSSFGSGSIAVTSIGSGDKFGLQAIAGNLFVPSGYSGGPLSGSAFFAGQDLAALGMTVGSYTWTWGSGATADSLTLHIIPEPTTALLLGFGLAGLGTQRRRLH